MTHTLVTRETYIRAETDRTFYNASQLTGGVNRMFSFRNVTPLDRQKVVRMNKDTLYTVALVDTSKGATITVPEMPAGRYFSVLLLDNDHYCPGVIYTPGTHQLPEDTKYLAINVRIQLLHPDDPADIVLVNQLQDQFILKANSADPFPEPKWDKESLAALTAEYNKEFAKFELYPDGWMGKRGEADETTRHLGCAGAWGLFPNKDAVYIIYLNMRIRKLPEDRGGLGATHKLQRLARIEAKSAVTYQSPDIAVDKDKLEKVRLALIKDVRDGKATDTSRAMGTPYNTDPQVHLYATAYGWGGMTAEDAA